MDDQESIALVKAYIDANYQVALTIERLARIACMSPSKLKYCFKAQCGETVYGYLTAVRMSRAARLLADTDLSVARVAERVGYKKSGAFAAVFKKSTGLLPREARRIYPGE
jgi:AraC-like DNA-binding protein